jgi:hypothetical protein
LREDKDFRIQRANRLLKLIRSDIELNENEITDKASTGVK